MRSIKIFNSFPVSHIMSIFIYKKHCSSLELLYDLKINSINALRVNKIGGNKRVLPSVHTKFRWIFDTSRPTKVRAWPLGSENTYMKLTR